MWQTARARVLKPFGLYSKGQIITLEAGDIAGRVESGHAELVGDIKEPETTEARTAPENAATRTTKPTRGRPKGSKNKSKGTP